MAANIAQMRHAQDRQLPSITEGNRGPTYDVKNALLECIENLETGENFASFGKLTGFVDPELFVPGVGPVALPLIEEKARALIQQCHQAPFGKGEQTIVDTSVRKTWELNEDQFEIQNPRWEDYIAQTLKAALLGIGFDQEKSVHVRADLYKMLLYEGGAMFKPHKEYISLIPILSFPDTTSSSEKAPGMFGTLVICLPSRHDGGAVNLRHAKQAKVFRTDCENPSYLCW